MAEELIIYGILSEDAYLGTLSDIDSNPEAENRYSGFMSIEEIRH